MSHLLRVLITSPTLGLENIFTEEAGYSSFILDRQMKTLPDLVTVDLIVFSGGDDIDPIIYSHERNPATQSKSMRDNYEIELAAKAHFAEVPMVGVCRGAQLLCALYGGTLYQDIPDHEGAEHIMVTKYDEKIPVSSAHHQACNLNEANMTMLGWSEKRVPWTVSRDQAPAKNPMHIIEEFIIRGNVHHFCAQYHPEWGPEPCTKHFMAQVINTCRNQMIARRQQLGA